jgi:DNA-binding Xre family transcriptional regulator
MIGGMTVDVSYKKLWKLLIDREIKKGELREMAGISSASMAKLGNNKNVNVDTLVRICRVLNCELSDIVDIIPEREEQISQR